MVRRLPYLEIPTLKQPLVKKWEQTNVAHLSIPLPQHWTMPLWTNRGGHSYWSATCPFLWQKKLEWQFGEF